MAAARSLTPEVINDADLATIPATPSTAPAGFRYLPPTADSKGWPRLEAGPPRPDPAVARLEILLDRVGASPGVIDGYDGENLRKAVKALELMQGWAPDGRITPELLRGLDASRPVIADYAITADDVAQIGPPIPSDYAAMAQLSRLGYTSVPEELAERFHMDEDFLKALNPGATFTAGETIHVADPGPDQQGKVAHIEADKSARQVRAYDADGRLLAAYPATIGSSDTPSPSGTHKVLAVVHDPTYTYNPPLNFKQGDNDQVLTIPPGPNGPVGSIWIDLSEPTYGIHGTPEPAKIDKTASHGCVRLTNWDATELAGMVSKGVPVVFLP
jgi:lipoprotein-anchoring transpeptidase ErfK/SrfK